MSKINKSLKNGSIFAIIFSIFFFADFLLKLFLFEKGSSETKDFTIIGIRSNDHYSTTFLDFLNIKIDNIYIILIGAFIALIVILLIIFAKSGWAVVGLSMILAGTIGNTIDNIFLGYVRNIFYTPWWDNGTFNLADVLIIIGIPFAIIPMFFNLYKY